MSDSIGLKLFSGEEDKMTELDRQLEQILSGANEGIIHRPYHDAVHRFSQVLKLCLNHFTPPNSLDQQEIVFFDLHNHRHMGIKLESSFVNPLSFDVALRLPNDPPVTDIPGRVENTLAIKQFNEDSYRFPVDSDKLKSKGLTIEWMIARLVPHIERTISQGSVAEVEAFSYALQSYPGLVQRPRM